MTDKVLGFKTKDAVAGIFRDTRTEKRYVYIELEKDEKGEREIRRVDLVPVNLKSESVEIEELRKLIIKLARKAGKEKRFETIKERFAYCDGLDDLLTVAEKKAKEAVK